ncbi:MAG: hypothetical protein ACE149_02565 [Armatimonadota bacterium]
MSRKAETSGASGPAMGRRGPLRRRLRRAAALLVLLWLVVVGWMAHERGAHVWGPVHLQWLFSRPDSRPEPVHVVFLIVDHFEPGRRSEAMDEWTAKRPGIAKRHADSAGRPPQCSWFYPEEQYREWQVAQSRELRDQGLGEVQVHLHHGGDTSRSLRDQLRRAKAHLLPGGAAKGAKQQFVFVHGNWALDNSRPAEGADNYCGVNDEITVLREEGCAADMTFPTLVHQAQPRTIDQIYYAVDDPERPKSYDTGVRATVGETDENTGLLMIPGPLLVNWREWHALHPTIEDGCIQGNNPPSPQRVDSWVVAGIGVEGAENWVFVKVHLHGASKDTRPVVLGKPMDDMFSYLEKHYNDGKHYVLHYVRASEAVALVHALERGDSDPLPQALASPGKTASTGATSVDMRR